MTPLHIIEVDHQSDFSLLVKLSDGTFASFTVDDLATLQPARQREAGESAVSGQDYL